MRNRTRKERFSELRESYTEVNLNILDFWKIFYSEGGITVLSPSTQLFFPYNSVLNAYTEAGLEVVMAAGD